MFAYDVVSPVIERTRGFLGSKNWTNLGRAGGIYSLKTFGTVRSTSGASPKISPSNNNYKLILGEWL